MGIATTSPAARRLRAAASAPSGCDEHRGRSAVAKTRAECIERPRPNAASPRPRGAAARGEAARRRTRRAPSCRCATPRARRGPRAQASPSATARSSSRATCSRTAASRAGAHAGEPEELEDARAEAPVHRRCDARAGRRRRRAHRGLDGAASDAETSRRASRGSASARKRSHERSATSGDERGRALNVRGRSEEAGRAARRLAARALDRHGEHVRNATATSASSSSRRRARRRSGRSRSSGTRGSRRRARRGT